MQYNHTVIIGRLTKDPEMRYSPAGTPIMTLAIAANRTYNQGDEKKEETLFLDCVMFGQTAERMIEYAHKGMAVLVEGRLQQRSWENDEGQKRSKIELVVNNMQLLERAS